MAAYVGRELRKNIESLMKRHRLRPLHRLGQHFLVDESAVRKFTEQIAPGALVYEIGCGLGSLTIPLAHRASYLLCSELDERLARILKEELKALGLVNVDIVIADALKFETSTRSHAVVSNTPFNISSRLIVELCRDRGLLYAVLGVQQEVGLRLLAKSGEKDFGRLSVIAQLCFQISKLFQIPPRAFIPKPEVATLVVRLTPKHTLSEEELSAIEELTRRLFSLRNKKVAKALKETFRLGDVETQRLLSQCEISHDQRVYELAPEQFLRMIREAHLISYSPSTLSEL